MMGERFMLVDQSESEMVDSQQGCVRSITVNLVHRDISNVSGPRNVGRWLLESFCRSGNRYLLYRRIAAGHLTYWNSQLFLWPNNTGLGPNPNLGTCIIRGSCLKEAASGLLRLPRRDLMSGFASPSAPQMLHQCPINESLLNILIPPSWPV